MIHDRGAKKWTAMMLPEHKRMLRYLFEEVHRKEKPSLDEQKHEQLNYMLQKAMNAREIIEITYYENGRFRRIKGVVHNANMQKGKVQVVNEYSGIETLLLKDIIEIS